MEFQYGIESALDLPLKGSVGTFRIGSASAKRGSIEVKYFLTHVSLNFESGSDEKLLRKLAPVREIFDPRVLDFDEIMQRDIDDARVSSELIPYILDDRTQDLIKFFPPIVVVVLPTDQNRRPASYYPEVTDVTESLELHGVKDWLITRSGETGAEVFQFEQPIVKGMANKHDLVTFRLNTSKCELVIVDGQHRAMALLALYRNIRDEWDDAKRRPFRKYYEEWTPSYIAEFDLKHINLPMIICTVPTLDEKYKGDYDLKKASRSIFLTLNKTARKVSRTRNILLDDNDLIASFMRRSLKEIKDVDDQRTSDSLRIHNIELDQERQKINTPIAITGVSHIHYIIEHILLDSGDIVGIRPRSGRFASRTGFADALDRLKCRDLLGETVCQNTRRDIFTAHTEHQLSEEFNSSYGIILLRALREFRPFEFHNNAAITLEERLIEKDVDLRAMLFEGQSIYKVFEDHRKNLRTKLDEGYFKTDVPRVRAIINELDATNERLNDGILSLQKIRAQKYVGSCRDKNRLLESAGEPRSETLSVVNSFYSDVITTVAFQAALVCGFYTEFEKASNRFQGAYNLDLDQEFGHYLAHLNGFFVPQSASQFRNVMSVLIGKVDLLDDGRVRVSRGSRGSFRDVVYPGEMQPDQWPKYRYLILEIWNDAISPDFTDRLKEERDFCRQEVARALYERKKDGIAKERRKTVEELQQTELDDALKATYDDYNEFLKYFGKASTLNEGWLRKAVHTAAEEGDEE